MELVVVLWSQGEIQNLICETEHRMCVSAYVLSISWTQINQPKVLHVFIKTDISMSPPDFNSRCLWPPDIPYPILDKRAEVKRISLRRGHSGIPDGCLWCSGGGHVTHNVGNGGTNHGLCPCAGVMMTEMVNRTFKPECISLHQNRLTSVSLPWSQSLVKKEHGKV